MKPITEKTQINEGIIANFIEKFFDSYKRGITQQFIKVSRAKDPELGALLDQADEHIRRAVELLKNRKYDR